MTTRYKECFVKQLSTASLLALGFLFSPFVSSEQATGAECVLIVDNDERLACYDSAFDIQSSNQKSVIGAWDVSENSNPMDDTKTVVLALDSTQGQNRLGRVPFLIMRCQSMKTSLYIGWNDYLGSDRQRVNIRIGTKKAKSESWPLSTDKTATFSPAPVSLIKQMLKADKLVMQTTPYNESPVTAVFPLAGLDEAIKPLRKVCIW